MQGTVFPLDIISESSRSLKSVPSMIYLPVDVKRFPLVLTLGDTSQFTVAQEATLLVPKDRVGGNVPFFTQKS